jgi:hypothetical protein
MRGVEIVLSDLQRTGWVILRRLLKHVFFDRELVARGCQRYIPGGLVPDQAGAYTYTCSASILCHSVVDHAATTGAIIMASVTEPASDWAAPHPRH